MEFLYPGFLYALAALAIPVIIHLFNFRRFKKVPFTNVRFLREIKTQTQAKNRLRHYLILLSRLLALAFLVFAFAQPYLPEEDAVDKTGERAVAVFIDNSFSMEGESEAGPLLEVAKNRAIDIAMAYDATDRFYLLTHDFEGKHQRFISQSQFIQWVQEVEISPESRSSTELVNRMNDLLEKSNSEKEIFVISDFQKSAFTGSAFAGDTTSTYSLVHIERNTPSNIFIDSVWFSSPIRKMGNSETVRVRVQNQSAERVEDIPIRLNINGKQKALGNFSAEAFSKVDTALSFVHSSPGMKFASIEIDDHPITYDDRYYFGYQVYDEIKVMAISDRNEDRRYLEAVYRADSTYSFESVVLASVDYSRIASQDLIILDELNSIPGGLSAALENFLEGGGSVWIIPSAQADPNSYNSFLASAGAGVLMEINELERRVQTINTSHPLYKGVFERIPRNIDLPQVKKYYSISASVRSTGDDLLTLQGGTPLLSSYPTQEGMVYLQSAPIRVPENNFARHAIFVPTALRIAELSRPTSIYALELSSQGNFSVPARKTGSETVFKLRQVPGEQEFIPAYQAADGRLIITPGPEVSEAGNYVLELGNDTVAALGLNYNRLESDLESYEREELASELEESGLSQFRLYDGASERLSREVEQRRTGTELWKICLILALVFLLIESLLLRIGKKALV
jgi:hypothetical protein